MNIPATILHLYPREQERQKRRDALMDALAKAKRRADYDDYLFYDEGQETEVSLQTFAEVEWETIGIGLNPHDQARVARAYITGARLGRILIDRETLDAAFGNVDALEEDISEQFTREGEY